MLKQSSRMLHNALPIISGLSSVAAISFVKRFRSLLIMSGAASKQKIEYCERYSSSDMSGLFTPWSSSALKPICKKSKSLKSGEVPLEVPHALVSR